MDGKVAIFMFCLPWGLFWLQHSMEWKPSQKVKGSASQLVRWISDFTLEVTRTIGLLVAVLVALMVGALYIWYDLINTNGLLGLLVAIYVFFITLAGLGAGVAKLFINKGKREGLIE